MANGFNLTTAVNGHNNNGAYPLKNHGLIAHPQGVTYGKINGNNIK
jgi:hypothetical protein